MHGNMNVKYVERYAECEYLYMCPAIKFTHTYRIFVYLLNFFSGVAIAQSM